MSKFFIFFQNYLQMAHDIGHKSYHEGFQQPIGGSHEVDLRARQIQEAAERLSVSTDASGNKTAHQPINESKL